jgi:glutamine synthetase
LGALEAPPAVVSMFLGTELTEILEAIETDAGYGAKEKEILRIGVHTLPKFPKDTTDRNRTSPFAFTGNKFEFRMLGSSASISDANTVLNTAVAEVLKQFADELETASDFNASLHELIKRTITAHKRIIFNGNGYDNKWIAEAKKRGLSNLQTTPDALVHFTDEKNIELFTAHKVYTEREIYSRFEILMESYCKLIHIEGRTMVDMAMKDILPAIDKYAKTLCDTVLSKRAVCADMDCTYETETLSTLSTQMKIAYETTKALEKELTAAVKIVNVSKLAQHYKKKVLGNMEKLRESVDILETKVSSEVWPFPTYGELLFGV